MAKRAMPTTRQSPVHNISVVSRCAHTNADLSTHTWIPAPDKYTGQLLLICVGSKLEQQLRSCVTSLTEGSLSLPQAFGVCVRGEIVRSERYLLGL